MSPRLSNNVLTPFNLKMPNPDKPALLPSEVMRSARNQKYLPQRH
jgi:hypothetical protein